MKLRISNVVTESIVDGEGLRYVVFTQGCFHGCVGCHNKHTQKIAGGYSIDLDELFDDIMKHDYIDGITISGGEPFLHADKLLILVKRLKEANKNIWIYSGHTFEELLDWGDTYCHRSLMELCDVLVDGEYVEAERDLALQFMGSRNQRIIDLPVSLKTGNVTSWVSGYKCKSNINNMGVLV